MLSSSLAIGLCRCGMPSHAVMQMHTTSRSLSHPPPLVIPPATNATLAQDPRTTSGEASLRRGEYGGVADPIPRRRATRGEQLAALVASSAPPQRAASRRPAPRPRSAQMPRGAHATPSPRASCAPSAEAAPCEQPVRRPCRPWPSSCRQQREQRPTLPPWPHPARLRPAPPPAPPPPASEPAARSPPRAPAPPPSPCRPRPPPGPRAP
mmetsp:Transcript_4524/g.15057  ORF Transcript_4524/g.15057 Transcript_4524/m.15057 type:complete len:209 (-) Transcript_4524:191-817(-)